MSKIKKCYNFKNMMKKILIILWIILLNIAITFWMLHFFVLSKIVLIEEWVSVSKNIEKKEAKIIMNKNSKLFWNINLEKWEIIFKENSYLKWDIFLKKWKIKIEKNVIIDGNLYFNGNIILGENSKINWNISKKARLEKHSMSYIFWKKPKLFITTDYPSFMKYFDSLPENHKNKFWYIYLTSHNMDIRENDLKAKKYFKKILFYKDKKLQTLDISKNPILVNKLYKNSKKYIEKLSEKKLERFWVWFVTKSWAFNKKKADMYISQNYANSELFLHEYWHIMDYAKNFIDYHNPVYPYPDRKNVITDYGAYHKWEDFAEWYRFYVLHNDNFQKIAKNNKVLKEKYNYFKKYVFENLEYN